MKTLKKNADEIDINNENKELVDIVSKWYFGNLDEHFYYSERNNEMFFDYLKEYLKE